ncbi:hypothetical protein PSAL_004540 [Pseudooceanicola algae]|uniref:Anti-sigma K factor RskA C-terminal domain-containing protein n=2 Tax=Pseudooceanicola algae TaxID=1537215 RepID=A0A418SFA4_9RHOB|nr:hypothetical protein PSAL_004540 [Pseudooceanicola algae]
MSDGDDHIPPEGGQPGDGDRILAAEYLLGLLSPAQATAFESRLTGDVALRDLTAAWADDFVAMTDEIAAVEPPARVWSAIQSGLWPEEASRATSIRTGASRNALFGRLFGGLAVAAMLAVLVMQSDLLVPGQPGYLADIASTETEAHFTAAYDPDSGALRLARVGDEAAAGRSYELWLIAGDAAPVSVAVWPEATEALEVPLGTELAGLLPGAVLAITDEPFGGAPNGVPTGPVVASGVVAEG